MSENFQMSGKAGIPNRTEGVKNFWSASSKPAHLKHQNKNRPRSCVNSYVTHPSTHDVSAISTEQRFLIAQDLDWLWLQQSSHQRTCLGVRGGKDPCWTGITGAATLVARQSGWPRTTCESWGVTSGRTADAQSLYQLGFSCSQQKPL